APTPGQTCAPGDGTSQAPFCSIQEAVDALAAAALSDERTVVIGPGHYPPFTAPRGRLVGKPGAVVDQGQATVTRVDAGFAIVYGSALGDVELLASGTPHHFAFNTVQRMSCAGGDTVKESIVFGGELPGCVPIATLTDAAGLSSVAQGDFHLAETSSAVDAGV